MQFTAREPDNDATKEVACEDLLSLALLETVLPVGGSELEHAAQGARTRSGSNYL